MPTETITVDPRIAGDKKSGQQKAPTLARQASGMTLRLLQPEEWVAWDALLDCSPQGAVFCRRWWLEASTLNPMVLGCFDASMRLVAGMPLYYRSILGRRLCMMPRITQTWGVVMQPLTGKRVTIAARELDILQLYAEHFKDTLLFVHRFHPSLQNWLPFYWRGFKQTARCTYTLDDLSDLQRIWDGFAPNVRSNIRKAENASLRVETCSIDTVFDMEVRTFGRQKKKLNSQRLAELQRLFNASESNDAGKCFAAVDGAGRIHAATFIVWDKNRTYYLAGGGDPELRNSGAQSLLVWHSIQFASQRSAVFDFCGSVIEPIERFVRSFGSKQYLYNSIIRCPWYIKILLVFAGKL